MESRNSFALQGVKTIHLQSLKWGGSATRDDNERINNITLLCFLLS